MIKLLEQRERIAQATASVTQAAFNWETCIRTGPDLHRRARGGPPQTESPAESGLSFGGKSRSPADAQFLAGTAHRMCSPFGGESDFIPHAPGPNQRWNNPWPRMPTARARLQSRSAVSGTRTVII
jgi:hypothetical protein